MFYTINSLWLPTGYHIMWNCFQGNVFGFEVSRTAPNGIYGVEIAAGRGRLTGGAFGLEGGLMATVFILVEFVITKLYCKWQNFEQTRSH